MRLGLILGWGLLIAVSGVEAAIITENFSTDPSANGWRSFGDASLFQWDSTNDNLRVTWDSARTNSYFHHPLPTILAKDDDFSLAFDLMLEDVTTGVDSNKASTFQIAIALLKLQNATRTNFYRGSGINATYGSRDSVEFDYFPESFDGITATVSPTMISSNNQFASSFTFPLELTVGDWFHVEMTYTATNHTLATIMTRNGQPFGPIASRTLPGSFTDFRLDTVAVCSFHDGEQNPPEFAGSIFAHGVVDDFQVITPDPPIGDLTGTFNNSVWQVQFISRTNWQYTLERSDHFESWDNASPTTPGTAGMLVLSDTNAPVTKSFYRIKAERP